MDVDAVKSQAVRKLGGSYGTVLVAMHAPGGDEPHNVQRSAARPRQLDGCNESFVFVETAGFDFVVQAGEGLPDDTAGADREVPDLGIAHLALGQADCFATGGNCGVGPAGLK